VINKAKQSRREITLPERKLSSQQVYHGRAVNLRLDTVEKPSGKKATREVVEHSDCIAVVVLDEQNNVLLVRQFRYPVGKSLRKYPLVALIPVRSLLTVSVVNCRRKSAICPGK